MRRHPHSNLRILQRWGLIALLEIVIALGLMAIAPTFLNSSQPWIGLLIWLSVLVMLLSSVVYLVARLLDVHQARQRFVRKFPKYTHLSWIDFLDLRASDVVNNLDLLEAADTDPEIQDLHISLIELLRRAKQR